MDRVLKPMQVRVILHSILQDLLPREARGQTTLDLAEGSTVADVRQQLRIPSQAVCAINGQIERDLKRILVDGDEVRIFRAGAGG